MASCQLMKNSSSAAARQRQHIPRAVTLLSSTLMGMLLASPAPTLAWGTQGHRLVAMAAQAQLTPAARTQVEQLLQLDDGASLSSVSTWADEARSPVTAKWHYVNLPQGSSCHYEAKRDCPDGQCIVEAIRRQTRKLANKQMDAEQRLKALKYIVHLVADVHQPLHAGFAFDRGGNLYQVRAFGHGTNLHAVWDTGLIQAWPGGEAALATQVHTAMAKVPAASTPQAWAEESCRIASSADFYPKDHKLPDAYADRMSPVVVQRLAAAAVRLAATLNEALR